MEIDVLGHDGDVIGDAYEYLIGEGLPLDPVKKSW